MPAQSTLEINASASPAPRAAWREAGAPSQGAETPQRTSESEQAGGKAQAAQKLSNPAHRYLPSTPLASTALASTFAGVEQTEVLTAVTSSADPRVLTAAEIRLARSSTAQLVSTMRRYVHLHGPIGPNQLDSWQTFSAFMRFQGRELRWLPLLLGLSYLVILFRRFTTDWYYKEIERIGWDTTDKWFDGDHIGHGRQSMHFHVNLLRQLEAGIFVGAMIWFVLGSPWFMMTGGKWMPRKWMWWYITPQIWLVLWVGGASVIMVQGYDVHIDQDLFSLGVYAAVPLAAWILAKGYSAAVGANIKKHVLSISAVVLVNYSIYGFTIPQVYFGSSLLMQFVLRLVVHPILVLLLLSTIRVGTYLLHVLPHDNAKLFPAFRVYWWTSMWGRYLVANADTLEQSVYLNLGLTVSELVLRGAMVKLDKLLLRVIKGRLAAAKIMSSPMAVRIDVDLFALDTFDELYGVAVSALIIWLFQWGNPVPGEPVRTGLLLQQTGFAVVLEVAGILLVPYLAAVLLGGGICGERARVRRKAVKRLAQDIELAGTLPKQAQPVEAATSQPPGGAVGSSTQAAAEMQPAHQLGPVVVSAPGSPVVLTPSSRSLRRLQPAPGTPTASPLPAATAPQLSFSLPHAPEAVATASYVGVDRITGQSVTLTCLDMDADEDDLRAVVIGFLARARPMDFWERSKRRQINIINASHSRPKYYFFVMWVTVLLSFDLFLRQFFEPLNTACATRLNDQSLWYATFQYHHCPARGA